MTPTIKFNCVMCGAEKVMNKSEFEAKIRETGVKPRYCSKPCAHAGRKRETERRRAA